MANDSLGTARVTLTVDTREFETRIDAARRKTTGLGDEADAAFQKASGSVSRASTSLIKYVRGLGASSDQQKLFNAAAAGVPVDIISAAAAAMKKHEDAIRAATEAQVRQNSIASQIAANAKSAEAAHDRMRQKLLDERAATDALNKSKADFVAKLQTEANAIGKSRSELLSLAAAEKGVTKEAAPFIAAIKAQEDALKKQHKQLGANVIQFNKYGISAKQQVAAMRQVPAQITDIFVSLQGGQNPLTVLLQQGGQLKDIFGGVVPAARALGSALLGLVNPFTVAAAAAGALFYAYLQGEQRINAFNRALILSGQAARLTSDDLQAMAQDLDAIAGITSSQGADALTQIIATGKIAVSQAELVAQAAARMQDVTGKAMSETIAEYADLAKDPVSAILRLNESENFLTESVYARIKALQDAGDIEAAAALATETRADSQIKKTGEVVESLGLVAGAWQAIKDKTGEAWDESTNYFANLDRDAKDAKNMLVNLWQSFKIPGIAGAFGMQQAFNPGEVPKGAAGEKTIDSNVQRQLDALKDGNRLREDRQKLEEQQIINLNKQLGFAEDSKKVQDELAASRKAYEESKPKGKGAGDVEGASNRAALQAIKDRLTEEQSLLQNSRQVLQAEYAAKLVSTEDYYKQTRKILADGTAAQEKAITDQLAILRERDVTGKKSIDTTREIGRLEAELTKVRQDAAAQDKVLTIQQNALNDARERSIKGYIDSLALENKALKDNVNAQIAAIGMGQKRAAQMQQIAALLVEQAAEEKKLADTLAEDKDQDKYDRELAALRAYMRERKRILEQGFEDEKKARENWLNGVSAGVQDWVDATEDVASQVQRITVNTLNNAADTIAEAALTGKLAWRDFLIDLGTQITKFLAKQAVMNFLKAFAQSDTGQQAQSSGGLWGQLFTAVLGAFTKNADGGVHKSANLSKYSGSIVDKPTFFAKGGNVMGEAGPEAILPLSRGPNGKLGVQAAGGGMGGDVHVTIATYIMADGSTRQETKGSDKTAWDQFGKQMQNVAQQEINKAMLPGGAIWRARGATA